MADNKVNKNVAPISSLTVPDPSKNQQKSGNICKSVAPLSSLTFPNSVVAAKSSNLSGLQPNNKSKLTTPQPPKTQLCSAPPGYESLDEVKVKTTSGLTPELYANNTTVVSCINRTFKTGDTTIIVETDKDVYVNTIEDINEQKFITNADVTGSALQVGTVTGSIYTNVACNISKLGFDSDSGFDVSDLGSGIAKIAMNSTFKFWEVNGNPGLTACGLDTVNFVAGCGVTITSCNTSIPKTLTISSTATGGVSSLNSLTGALTLSAGNNIAIGTAGNVLTICGSAAVGGCNTQVQYNNSGAFAGSSGLTYCSTTSTLGVSNISTATGLNIAVGTPITDSWISLYGDLGVDASDEYSSSVSYDSSGNIYSIGADGNTGVPFLVKYSPTGSIIWQVNFTEVNNYYKTGDAVEVDSSGNVYAIIGTDDAALEDFTLIKLNSSGTILWQKSFDIAAVQDAGVDIAVDSSSNVYVLAAIDDTDVTFLAKLNSSGVVQWQRTLTVPVSSFAYPQGMAVDGSGNIYIHTQNNEGGTYRPSVLVKYNTSGILQWQMAFGDGTSAYYSGLAATDSSGNVYTANTGPGAATWLIKWSSSGSIIWQKIVDLNSPVGLSVDSSNNIYLLIEDSNLVTFKFDSAGNLLWQMELSRSGGIYAYYYWATQNLDVSGSYYAVSGYTYTPSLANPEAIVAQLPTDGTGQGIYGDFSYTASNYIISTSTLTSTTSTLVDAAGSMTVTNGTYTTATATATNTLTPVNGLNNFTFNTDGALELPGYTLPGNRGSNGQLLTTNGAGSAYWSTYSPPAAQPFTRGIVYGCVNVNNTALGVGSGVSSPSGGNTSIGVNSSYSITTGCNNTAVGHASMLNNKTGRDNVAVGIYGLHYACSPDYTVAIGSKALAYSCCSCNSIAIGFCSQGFNNGFSNIAIGSYSQQGTFFGSSNTGNNNVSIGQNSLSSNTYGNCNIAIGCGAGGGITTGCNNTVIGSLPATNCNSTVLIGAGSCERIKVDGTGLYINGSLFSGATAATPTTLGSVFGYTTVNGNTSIGCCSGNTTQTGYHNFAAGFEALKNNTGGSYNIAIGYVAMCCNTIGQNNVALGYGTLMQNTCGAANFGAGAYILRNNTSGSVNFAVGSGALFWNTFGSYNFAAGLSSLCCNTTGCHNVAIGISALQNNRYGNNNIAIGCAAAAGNSSGGSNLALGWNALRNNTIGSNSIALGECALLFNNSVGNQNIGIGYAALYSNTTGCFNVALGILAASGNTSGSRNIGIGQCALYFNGGNCDNIGIGANAGRCTCFGVYNVAIGSGAMQNIAVGSNNVALGYRALYGGGFRCQQNSVAVGAYALESASQCASNIAVGYGALRCICLGSSNIAVGCLAGVRNVSGLSNIYIGNCAGCCTNTGSNNTIIGSLCAAASLECTVLIGAGTCERVKVDNSGLYVNGSLFSVAVATPTSLGTVFGYTTGNGNTSIGCCAGNTTQTGCNNIAIGCLSLFCNTTGAANIAIGSCALLCTTWGRGNVAIGAKAAANNLDGRFNVAIGECALFCNVGVSHNIAIGYGALRCSSPGNDVPNIALGKESLRENTTGTSNIAIGSSSLLNFTTGIYNLAIGPSALNGSTGAFGCGNIALGALTLISVCSGCNNIAFGVSSLRGITSANNNIAQGYQSQYYNVTGQDNIAIGTYSLNFNYTGSNNIAIGSCSLKCSFSNNNIGIGTCAGCLLSTGANNTIIGNLPAAAGCVCTLLLGAGTCERIRVDNTGLYINGSSLIGATLATPTSIGSVFGYTTGSGNVSIGCCAGNTTQTGFSNIAIGCLALKSNTTGYGNTSIGVCSLTNNTIGKWNIGIGGETLRCNTSGCGNTALGYGSLFYSNTGQYNTAIGFYSMGNVTVTGNCNIAIGPYSGDWAGDENIAIGVFAGQGNPGANENIAIGKFSLSCNLSGATNIALGSYALGKNVSGSTNIAIGVCAGCNITTGTNNTIIGSLSAATGCVCTVLIGAGTCERIKVDNTGLCINGVSLTGNGLCNTSVGFRIVPQNTQCADYTIAAADSAGHVLHPAVDTNPRTYTIPSNAAVAFPIGTSITIVNESFYPVTIAINSDTLYLAGSTTVGSRTLGQNGVATILKIQSTVWLISGSGLT